MQELPQDEQRADPLDNAKAYVPLKAFNLSHCAKPQLRTCFSDSSDTMYGTLSHSHLLLVLLSMKTGASWTWPAEWAKIIGVPGGVLMSAVAAKDADLANLLTEGLGLEVLSWKLYKEEPAACSLISQALNSGQTLALRTSELTALAVLSGTVTLELESAVARIKCPSRGKRESAPRVGHVRGLA